MDRYLDLINLSVFKPLNAILYIYISYVCKVLCIDRIILKLK